VDEPTLLYDVETGTNARDIKAMRVLDRLFVGIVLNNDGIERPTGFIDKMNTIWSHWAHRALHAGIVQIAHHDGASLSE
jgi:hypothetical protein